MAKHPLLTKDRDTAVKGHHHPTEHVELHHHLRLDIEGEEKSQNLKYLKIKTKLRVAQPTYLPQHPETARQGHCAQLPHHLDVVDRQDYQQERVYRQQGHVHVWEELRTYLSRER